MLFRILLVVTSSLLWSMMTAPRVVAQVPNLIELSGQYSGFIDIPDLEPAQAQQSSYQAELNIPIPASSTLFLIPGLSYNVQSIAYSNVPDNFIKIE